MPGKDRIAGALGAWHAFAGDRAFVDARRACRDITISRNAITGAHQHDLADLQAGRVNLARGPVRLDQRRLGDQLGQRADAVTRFVGGNAFQYFAHGEQEHDKGRFFRRIDEQGPGGGYGHEHFDSERNARAQGCKGTDGNRGHPDNAGGDKGPSGQVFGPQQLDRPGGSQQ